MDKILILTYYFPPLNMTASMRAYSWAKYFSEFGLEPTVICRSWQSNPVAEVNKIEGETYEVYEVLAKDPPLHNWLQDKSKLKRVFSGYLGKIFEFFDSYRTDTYPIYKQAVKLLETGAYKYLMVVTEPFVLFKYGYELHRKFNIKWVADYRDDWNTSEKKAGTVNPLLRPFILKSNQDKERKYINSAEFFTSVSEPYVKKIEDFTGKKGHVIENGYFFEDDVKLLNDDALYPEFTISHGGTISYGRDPLIFVRGFNKLIEKYGDKLKLKCNLLGAYPFANVRHPNQELKELIDQHPENYNLTDRLPREEALEVLRKSHLLLIIGVPTIAGVPSSKLYEYIGLRKPVIVCPSDNDIIEKSLQETGQGIICNTSEEVTEKLTIILDKFLETGNVDIHVNEETIPSFSRRNAAERFVDLIKSI